ncbi:MAG: IS3 family transposase [Woeseia sp.]
MPTGPDVRNSAQGKATAQVSHRRPTPCHRYLPIRDGESGPLSNYHDVPGVSPGGYYAWQNRPSSARSIVDELLTEKFREFHQQCRGNYGAPRIHADLKDDGWRVRKKRVARLLKAAGLRGVCRRKGTVTTRRDTASRAAADLALM